MNTMEQRLRDSLKERAMDVEPTPDLWREVDRRITRRQRLRVVAWSLAGAAVVAAVLLVPGLLGTDVTPPEIEPVTPPGDAEETVEEPTDDQTDDPRIDEPTDDATQDTDTDTDTGDSGPVDDPVAGEFPAPVLVGDNNTLRLLSADGEVVVHRFDPEGEVAFVTGIAVRPGSTVDDLTAAVMTQAEGMWDLRELRVIDGETGLEVFPEAYRPGVGSSTGDGLSVLGPVWSPDGASLAWLEFGTGDTALRVVGWSDDGPGTGDRATDNARWSLSDTLPPGSTPHDWVATTDGTVIRVTMPDSTEGWYAISLDRQADGAWSLGSPDVEVVPTDDPTVGQVAALGGVAEDSDARTPRWMVRLTFDGAVLTEGPDGAAGEVELPAGLMPGTGLADLWMVVLGDDVLVGSASTASAWHLSAEGEPVELPGGISHADAVR